MGWYGGGGAGASVFLKNYLTGLTMSTAGASTTMTVAAGIAADSTNALMMVLASSMNKTTSAFAAGSGNGGMDTGSVAVSTWYHFFLISNAAGTSVDVLFSLSATAPTMPSGFTLFRRIGSMKTTAGTANWGSFVQNGDVFSWLSPPLDFSSNLTTTASTITLASCPTGIIVLARINLSGAPAVYNYISALNTTDLAPAATAAPGASSVSETVNFWYYLEIETNTSAQIRGRGFTTVTTDIVTFGWRDYRGK
jgi:hypothetical protein